MALKKITVIYSILSFMLGMSCMTVAIIALTTIDIKLLIGKDTGVAITIMEALRNNFILSILILLAGYSHILWGKNALLGKKAVLNLNINYKIISIETDDAKSTVKIDLKDTKTGDEVIVQRKTNYPDYFKKYIKMNGEIMPGTIASIV